MGSRKYYEPGIGITFFEYKATDTIDGVKIIVKPGEIKPALPVYSNTADTAYILAKKDEAGQLIPMQLRVFKNHLAYFDVDFGHPQDHNLPPGHYHTHSFGVDYTEPKPKVFRKTSEHRLTDDDKEKYGKLIKKLQTMHNQNGNF